MNLLISTMLAFSIIFLMSSALSKILKNRIEVCIPLSIMFIVVIIYPFGFFRRLDIGFYVVIAVTIISSVYLIYGLIKCVAHKQFKEYIRDIITPGLFVYILLWGIIIFINKNRVLSAWDEFSHWGLIVKNMFEFNSFASNPETIVMFRDYPPFSAIFEYFILKLTNVYQEDEIIISMGIINLSMIMPVLKNVEWRKGFLKLIICIPLLFFMPLPAFDDFYTTIYIDALLGIFTAYVLYLFFSEEGSTRYISVGVGLLCLPLIKAAGTGLAALALVIICVDLIFFSKETGHNKSKKLRKTMIIIFLIACLLAGKYSWSIHLNMTNTNSTIKSSFSMSSLKKLIKGQEHPYRYEVMKIFKDKFFKSKLDYGNCNITSFGLLVVYVIYSIYIYICIKANQHNLQIARKYITYSLLLFVSFIVYTFSLLIVYLYSLSSESLQYEALNLASYRRYLSTGILYMYVFNTLIFMKYFQGIRKDKLNTLVIIAFIFISISPNNAKKMFCYRAKIIENGCNLRAEYEGISKYRNVLNANDKIFYISCGSSGLDFHISRYEMVPIRLLYDNTSTFMWSPGKPRSENDIWSYDISVGQLEQCIIRNEYNYVYVYRADDIFRDAYYGLFENRESITDESMYRVEVNESMVKLYKINK